MGGLREDTLQGPSSSVAPVRSGTTTVGTVQQIRIHEANRQVHFHDDAAKLKVAIPVDTWYKAWVKIINTFDPFTFYDMDNKAMLTIQFGEDANGVTDATLVLEKMDIQDFGDTFQRLQRFTMGK